MSLDAKQSLFALAAVLVLIALVWIDVHYELQTAFFAIPVLMAVAQRMVVRAQNEDGKDS